MQTAESISPYRWIVLLNYSLIQGIIIGMAATPFLTISFGIPGMLIIYGVISLVGAVCFFIFIKPAPKPADADTLPQRTKVLEGLRHIIKIKDMLLLITIIFIGLGIFNAITTWIEQMIAPRGFSILKESPMFKE